MMPTGWHTSSIQSQISRCVHGILSAKSPIKNREKVAVLTADSLTVSLCEAFGRAPAAEAKQLAHGARLDGRYELQLTRHRSRTDVPLGAQSGQRGGEQRARGAGWVDGWGGVARLDVRLRAAVSAGALPHEPRPPARLTLRCGGLGPRAGLRAARRRESHLRPGGRRLRRPWLGFQGFLRVLGLRWIRCWTDVRCRRRRRRRRGALQKH
eukprot:SAG31_NODE_1273_length_9057_cov_13.364103_10_plen_210_part_00